MIGHRPSPSSVFRSPRFGLKRRGLRLWQIPLAALVAGVCLSPGEPEGVSPGVGALVALVPGVCLGDETPSDKRPLELQLPRPQFIGTPIHLKIANLREFRPGTRPVFYVPAGVENAALHKPVTASDTVPTLGELGQVTDGDKDGYEGSYVEIGPGRQSFEIDLQERYQIFAIVVWHYHAQARVYHDVVVQVADDPDFKDGVRTVFNNDFDNSSGLGVGRDREYIDSHEGLLIDVPGVTARYVRLYGNGNTENDLNHCTEIEVYGRRKPANP
jgi:hypothetical protein